mmetsp:Transcript_9572/g.14353  ORF Transcript_9572/g.14353 Transcript_9572/m.14353 type:complete len:292 (-) Transcript_9572:79-954(-)
MALKEISAGTLAGVAQVAVGHPFDTVKVRMQCQTPGEVVFKGTLDCFWKTFRYEGIKGLYKGAYSPLLGAMAQNAAGFYFFGWSTRVVRDAYNIEAKQQLNLRQTFAAGWLSACFAIFVETPVDLLKVKMQTQLHGQKAEYRSVFHAAYKIMGEHGIAGLFQGLLSNSFRFIPGRAVYFTSYQWAVETISGFTGGSSVRPSLAECFLAGGICGGITWTSTYPFDVIRNRIQADAAEASLRKYRGMIHCGREIAKAEGFHGFFRGFTACMIRAVPVNACIFTTYTTAMRSLE